MTAVLLDRVTGPSPATDAPAGAGSPAGATIVEGVQGVGTRMVPGIATSQGFESPPAAGAPSTPPRNFFDGCDTVYTLPKYVAPCGPPNPNSRTLADVVKGLAA